MNTNSNHFKLWNPNPVGRHVEDCTVRALTAALGIDWEQAYDLLVNYGFQMADMPHANSVLSAVLRKNGFYKDIIPNTCPDCYSALDFCIDHPKGTYVLGFNGHVACVVDGILYDSWNSLMEVPQFFWYRR